MSAIPPAHHQSIYGQGHIFFGAAFGAALGAGFSSGATGTTSMRSTTGSRGSDGVTLTPGGVGAGRALGTPGGQGVRVTVVGLTGVAITHWATG